MVWIVGVDEAGYGPNLGPFVMTAVACRADDALADACLWSALRPAVRRAAEADDGRPAVDDSKAVYNTARGLAALEHGGRGASVARTPVSRSRRPRAVE